MRTSPTSGEGQFRFYCVTVRRRGADCKSRSAEVDGQRSLGHERFPAGLGQTSRVGPPVVNWVVKAFLLKTLLKRSKPPRVYKADGSYERRPSTAKRRNYYGRPYDSNVKRVAARREEASRLGASCDGPAVEFHTAESGSNDDYGHYYDYDWDAGVPVDRGLLRLLLTLCVCVCVCTCLLQVAVSPRSLLMIYAASGGVRPRWASYSTSWPLRLLSCPMTPPIWCV